MTTAGMRSTKRKARCDAPGLLMIPQSADDQNIVATCFRPMVCAS